MSFNQSAFSSAEEKECCDVRFLLWEGWNTVATRQKRTKLTGQLPTPQPGTGSLNSASQ
jgi:hypothetical protein